MAMSEEKKQKIKKVLIGISAAVVAVATIAGAAYGISQAIQKNNTPSGPSIIDPNPNPGPTDPTDPTGPTDPTDPTDPDPEEPTDPEEPEITEEEYKLMCKEKLDQIALQAIQNGTKFGTISNVEIIKINEIDSIIYCKADYSFASVKDKYFYTVDLQENLVKKDSYEETYNYLNKIDYKLSEIKYETTLQPEISKDLYKEFSNYIKEQTYTFGEETVDFSKTNPDNLEIINITNTINDGRRIGFGFKIVNNTNNKIYSGEIMGALGSSSVDDQITELMGKTTNIFEITKIDDFKEFKFETKNDQTQTPEEFVLAQNYLNSIYNEKYKFSFDEPKQTSNSTIIKTNINEYEQ